VADALDLPPMIDVVTAARYLGVGRTTAYALAARGALPVPVVRIGTALRIPTLPLLKILGIASPDVPDTATETHGAGAAPHTDTGPAAAPVPHGREDPPRPPLCRPAKWSVDQPRTR
jgi:excisionase family DNA binding protein